MAKRYYELTVAGVTRQLPILNVTETLAIAGFVMLGDVELVTRCAQAMAKKVPAETEVILTAETKGIPLAEELARALGMDRYIVARKPVKAYMENALWVDDVSITTKGTQKLCLDGTDIERIKGVITALREVLDRGDIRIFGNVEFGRDITLDDLKRHYNAVIFATGAIKDADLDIPGIDAALAEALVGERRNGAFNDLADANQRLGRIIPLDPLAVPSQASPYLRIILWPSASDCRQPLWVGLSSTPNSRLTPWEIDYSFSLDHEQPCHAPEQMAFPPLFESAMDG
mgnify:CR=1 FL=1